MSENTRSFHGPLSERVRACAAAFCQGQDGRLLDVGCGNGLLFETLRDISELRLYGVDRSVELLAEARRHTADRGGCVNGMLDRLPFERRSFDVVVCLNTLLNLRSLDVVSVALGEMTRVSRGYVLVDIRNGDNPLLRFRYWRHRRRATFPTVGYRLQDMKEIFRHNGFPVEQVFPIGVDHPWLALGYVIAARRKDM